MRSAGERAGSDPAGYREQPASRPGWRVMPLRLICFGFAADTRAAPESDRILHRVRNASSVLPSSRRKLHRCRINLSKSQRIFCGRALITGSIIVLANNILCSCGIKKMHIGIGHRARLILVISSGNDIDCWLRQD